MMAFNIETLLHDLSLVMIITIFVNRSRGQCYARGN